MEFGELDARLARMHEVADRHRTKFQARLKNLHRIGWPLGFQSTKGRASLYSPGAILDMAVAMELVQLGLTPERICGVLTANRWPTLAAYRVAAERLAQSQDLYLRGSGDPGPEATVIYFEASALSALVDEANANDLEAYFFFFSSATDLESGLRRLLRESRRVSLLNLTDLLEAVATGPFETGSPESVNYRRRFFQAVAQWAASELGTLENRDLEEAGYVARYVLHTGPMSAGELAARAAIGLDTATGYIEKIYGNDT